MSDTDFAREFATWTSTAPFGQVTVPGAFMRALCDRYALASAAFEIMTRRLWFPRFIGSDEGGQRWEAYSWHGSCSLRETLAVALSADPKPDLVRRDPYTAIVAAEAWYVANERK